MFARIKKSGKYQYLQIVENRKEKGKIKNPPPEGVVLSLPLKGDKNASCPQRGRGLLSPI